MKIKLIIFDLDGVLIDSRNTHYITLNKALETINPKYIISYEEHISTYDGLSTKKKLELLNIKKGLDTSLFDKIWRLKQEYTLEFINLYEPDQEKISLL